MKQMLRRAFAGERAGTVASSAVTELLGYQALVGDGVALMRDGLGAIDGGALLAGWWYRGPDVESASAEAMASLSGVVNNAIKKLDAGWMLHVEAVRIARHIYTAGAFDESVDALIDEERAGRAHHYTTEFALFASQAPGVFDRGWGKRARSFFLGETSKEVLDALETRVERFERKLEELEGALSAGLRLSRMRSTPRNDELLQALQLVVNGRWQECRAPRKPVDLACLLARDVVFTPDESVHGVDYVEVVGLLDLPPRSVPGLLHALTQIDCECRWSSRFILMDYGLARSELKALEAKWVQKLIPITAQMFRTAAREDLDAVDRVNEVQSALADLESGVVRYGHYTSVVVLRAPTREEAREKAAKVVAALEERNFVAVRETHNRMEAWLGSLPGHGEQNVRRPMVHSLNFADLIPLGRDWEGSKTCPSPMLPAGSPALLQVRSWSGSPYYLNLHSGDLGHTLVLGPPGAGKSTLLAELASQWMRYERAQVVCFDQGASMAPLTLAHVRTGAYFHLGGATAPQLCPLAELDTDQDRDWAAGWLEGLCELQGKPLSAEARSRLFEAVCELAKSTADAEDKARARSLTHLLPHVLDQELCSALEYYVSGPAARVLNGDSNALTFSRFTMFELEDLFECGEKTVLPTLLFLFRQVEKRLDGRPTLAIFDEGWKYFRHPAFAERLRAYLKTFRRRNCAMVLATQQLSDIAESNIGAVAFESCPTRILLPNENATASMRRLYAEALNLTEPQIELVTQLEKKRWYMHVVGAQSRVFTLDLGPVARAFCAASSRQELEQVGALVRTHGSAWPAEWLRARGLERAALRFEELELERASREVAAMRERALLSARKAG